MKICNCCCQVKDLNFFESSRRKEKSYLRNTCKQCRNKKEYLRRKSSGQYEERKIKQRQRRHDPKNRAKYILRDSLFSDNKKCLDNDLTEDFINLIIGGGCYYCGRVSTQKLKIGLDRIDNKKGHTQDNVLACCSTCNFIRRDISFDAWKIIYPAVRQAIVAGLLDEWDYRFHRWGKND